MMMEDHMEDRTDTNSLYVLVCSLFGTVISLPVVSPKPPMLLLVWLRKTMYRSEKRLALYLFLGFTMSWLLTSTLVIGYSVP
jgi:hypothetical protein